MKNPWDVLRGRELPVVVFWVYCVMGMALAIMFLGMYVMGAAQSDRAIQIAGVLFLAYAAWAHGSLWMCASNARRRVWKYIARIHAAVALAIVAATLIWPFFVTTGSAVEATFITEP